MLSVVIPTLNEEVALPGCLESIGVHSGVEIVVSDGGSTDRTVAVARTVPQLVVVEGSPGRGQQLRRGAAAASGSILVFLHADCRLPAGWLEAVHAALADPAVALACFRLATEPVNPVGSVRRAWLRLLDLRSRGPFLPYGDQAFALRREVYARSGGFDPIPLMEDVALARRCRRLGRIGRVPLSVRASARRFELQPVRTRLMTLCFPWLYRLGVPPRRLAQWYGELR
jgi:rSAM/selenodomain-associated transferase 2